MKRLLLLSIFLAAFCQFSLAQTGIKGRLVDTADNKSLDNSVIALLKRDSVLVGFTRADASGNFELKVPNDSLHNYIVMVTHPSFADFSDSVNLTDGEIRNLDIVHMLSKAQLLEEVIVRGNRSMFMRGDTTIFTADSFKVAEGANVEELLKKLPGLQVDRNGQITAMGETVKKVLVDGEEFFGSDPGIATKNLQANVVQEVQVYDRKSDQANFTGIDDGTRDKTVNLKLKEDKKKGYFGKIDTGGGIMDEPLNKKDRDRYYGAAMLNAFRGKRKIAAYGITSNTGFMNLDWDDNEKFGGGGNSGVMEGGGFYISTGDWNSSTGLPVNYNGGFHYSNKFNEDKNSLNTGYKFVQIDAPGNTRRFSKNFADKAAPWSTNYENDFRNNSKKHSLNGTFETKLDSMNTIKLTAGGNLNFSENQSTSHSESIDDGSGNFLNKNEANSHGKMDQKSYNANLLWMHKFKKEFRSFSINTGFNASESKGDALVYSKTDFFNTSIGDSTAIIDQQNLVNNNNSNLNSRISYTEPLMKDFYMETSYSFAMNKRQNDRDIFAKGANGYNNKIDSLSNDYEFNDMSNSPGVSFRLTRKKLNASVGTVVGFTRYSQLNKTTGAGSDFNFTNHFPRANISYQIKPSERLWFNYNGNTSAPSLEQMQPIRNNTDQLNQYIGNPALRPSFRHSFNTSYNNWKMLNQRSIYVSFNGSFTQNAFSTFSKVSRGARTTQTVNANGIYNINFYGSYNRLVSKKLNLSMGLNPEFSLNNGVDFISLNDNPVVRNNTRNERYALRLRIGMDKEKKYDFNIAPNISYNIANGSINNLANAKYWAWGGDIWTTIYLPKNFELQNNVDAEFRQKDKRFPTNNNFVFWDAELRKWLYKKELQVKFVAKDILNQRNGYNRNFSSSSFTETYNTILKRHFLLGVVWNFNKMGAGTTPAK